jgi:sugar lactone lactonase YvrE
VRGSRGLRGFGATLAVVGALLAASGAGGARAAAAAELPLPAGGVGYPNPTGAGASPSGVPGLTPDGGPVPGTGQARPATPAAAYPNGAFGLTPDGASPPAAGEAPGVSATATATEAPAPATASPQAQAPAGAAAPPGGAQGAGGPAPGALPQGSGGGRTVRLPPGFALEQILGGQDGPVAVALDETGVPFVAEEGGGGRILRLTPGGGATTVAAGGFPLPLGGLLARRGVIDLAAAGAILQLPAQGGARRTLAVGMRGPLTGLAAGPDGSLYVGVTGTGHVAALPWAGGVPQVAVASLNQPTGLAFSAHGDLYVADDGAGGDELLEVRPSQAGPAAAPRRIARLPADAVAAGIAVAPPGPFRPGPEAVVYVAVSGGIDAVDVLTGQVRPFLTTLAAGGPRRPAGIAFAPDGRALYIADLGQTFANVPLPGTGAVWRVMAVAGPAPAEAGPAAPAVRVTPAPGPQNKVRPVAPPLPWYRQPHAVLAGAGALLVLALLLLVQFRRTRQ